MSKKNERVPFLSPLIDIAEAATFDYLSHKWQKKNGGKRKNKVNPYRVTGAAIGVGAVKNTEDLIRLGGVLGAMGAFDPDEQDEITYRKSNNNRYAWRLNCEDGSAYSVYPEDYETRTEYHEALRRKKADFEDKTRREPSGKSQNESHKVRGESEEDTEPLSNEGNLMEYRDIHAEKAVCDSGISADVCGDLFEEDDFHRFIYCLVKTDTGSDYYRTEDNSIRRGDKVIVLENGKATMGTVLTVEHHMRFSVPKDLFKTNVIIQRLDE